MAAVLEANTMESSTGKARSLSTVEGEHLIGAFIGDQSGPTLIVVGGIHGNEPAGVRALHRVADKLADLSDRLKGRVYLLTGNTRALSAGTRFIDADLNRSWTSRSLANVVFNDEESITESLELGELDRLFDSILITAKNEVYVVDLHSTSAGGVPFATVGDTLRNRRFARSFPITILLGIEEQLEGTMLEYLNNAGTVTLGFEGGQHDAEETVDNHEALTWLALVNSGLLTKEDVAGLEIYKQRLDRQNVGARIFEVRYRHPVAPDDNFQMRPGFINFDAIAAGDVLAEDRNGEIRSKESGVIFMPLYQKLGEDGFFVGRHVASFWIYLSSILRRFKLYELMPMLPGVRRDPADPSTLRVNTRIARLFPLQIFHLLGYRRRRWLSGELVVSRRKHDTESPFVRS